MHEEINVRLNVANLFYFATETRSLNQKHYQKKSKKNFM